MNSISGRIVLKESGTGISDLLVAIYSGSLSPSGAGPLVQSNTSGERLGSVITDADGRFQLSFEDADIIPNGGPKNRPGLILLVLAPEEDGKDADSRLLYQTRANLQMAGRKEEVIIKLTRVQLQNAGISIFSSAGKGDEPQVVKFNTQILLEQFNSVRNETMQLFRVDVDRERSSNADLKKKIQEQVLSKLPGIIRDKPANLNVVPINGAPEKTVWQSFSRTIQSKINHITKGSVYIQIPEAEISKFMMNGNTFRKDIKPEEIEPYIFGKFAGNRFSTLVREDPITALCQDKSQEQAGRRSLSNSAAAAPVLNDENNQTRRDVTPAIIPAFVGRLLNTLTTPEEGLIYEINRRATWDDIQQQVTNFQLHSGPADVPAYYDFHSLQIAFDFVWQQVIDDDILNWTKEFSEHLVELGGNPLEALKKNNTIAKALNEEWMVTQKVTGPVLRNSSLPSELFENTLQQTGINYGRPTGSIFDSMVKRAAQSVTQRNATAAPVPPPPRADQPPAPPRTTPSRPVPGPVAEQKPRLLQEIEAALAEPYVFDVFAPGSVNFGVLVTYRQKWDPVTYQVGNLVSTITLAPRETRKMTKKRVVKKDRMIREMENNVRNKKEEAEQTGRDESQIIQRAETSNHFGLNLSNNNSISVADLGLGVSNARTLDLSKDDSKTSEETKKSFRESVFKAAQEFRDERKVEIESKETFEEEVSETIEISNPNDEIPVTYLFYELQRRYLVSENLHRLTPVVMVAMEVPKPSRQEIDQLLFSHGWIINRVLLDNSFRPGLNYLLTRMVGNELSLQTKRHSLEIIYNTVDLLGQQLMEARSRLVTTEYSLRNAMNTRAGTEAEEGSEGLIEKGVEFLLGNRDGGDLAALRLKEDLAKEAMDRAVRQEKEILAKLERETSALNQATEEYTRANAEHHNYLFQIANLRLHIKQNMLYYMQAIWKSTYKDQLFFALYKTKVPSIRTKQKTYSITGEVKMPPPSLVPKPGAVVVEASATVEFESKMDPKADYVSLVDVADLDRPLGFKGNYMIFPLKESNDLTTYLMTPYIDAEFGLRDPDALGNWTPAAFLKFVDCLRDHKTPEEFATLEPLLQEQYRRIVSSPRRAEEELIIPTGSLYIDALPGAHPVLENFKLMHRAIDVKKVQAEVRKMEMENVRYAARLLEGEREDPEVEKHIIYKDSLDADFNKE